MAEAARDHREIVAAVPTGTLKVSSPPPVEPNVASYYAKSIYRNFAAQEFGGRRHLWFDDTNPPEEQEYIDAVSDEAGWVLTGAHLYHVGLF